MEELLVAKCLKSDSYNFPTTDNIHVGKTHPVLLYTHSSGISLGFKGLFSNIIYQNTVCSLWKKLNSTASLNIHMQSHAPLYSCLLEAITFNNISHFL